MDWLHNGYIAVAVGAYILGAGTAVYLRGVADAVYNFFADLADWATSLLTILGAIAVAVGAYTKWKGLW